MDSLVASIGIGELILLEVAPTSLDAVQFGGLFRQSFEDEPTAFGEGTRGKFIAVDQAVIENRDQGTGAFGGALCGGKLLGQGNKVGEALGGVVCIRRCRCTGKGAEHSYSFA